MKRISKQYLMELKGTFIKEMKKQSRLEKLKFKICAWLDILKNQKNKKRDKLNF